MKPNPEPFLVTSAYAFSRFKNPETLCSTLALELKRLASLRGTILVATEGINIALAGHRLDVEIAKACLTKEVAGLQGTMFKDAQSPQQVFKRLLVKVKNEIITMNGPLDPQTPRGKSLGALELKKWLDEDRDFLLLDARNLYEWKVGTFKGAITAPVENFSSVAKWVQSSLDHARLRPIVTFCTGGIRCEKLTAQMLQEGFQDVYQLEGGVLKYFELTQGTDNHWEGECTVFDRRLAVDRNLKPTSTPICYVCLSPIETHASDERCASCQDQMDQSQRKRQAAGQAKMKAFHARRMAYLAAERLARQGTQSEQTVT